MKFIGIIEDIEDRVGQILNSKIERIDDTLKWSILDGFGGWTDGVDHDVSAKVFVHWMQTDYVEF